MVSIEIYYKNTYKARNGKGSNANRSW
jgi:hypothetical protein